MFYFETQLLNPPVDLYFYNERVDNQITAVFESYINKQLIDRYVLGESNSSSVERNYSARKEILKCPIIIKTSSGDLELLPNGKFVESESSEIPTNGKYRFDIAFAEWQGNSIGEKVTVVIKTN